MELETDKVNVEVPSPAEGTISKINFSNGDVVEVGAILGTIGSKIEKTEKIVPINKSKKQAKKKEDKNEEKNMSIFDDDSDNNEPLVLDTPSKEQ